MEIKILQVNLQDIIMKKFYLESLKKFTASSKYTKIKREGKK